MPEDNKNPLTSTPAYCPVYAQEGSDAWYPSNRAANLLVHINHIWRDLVKLSEIRMQHKEDKVAEKLLFKYAIVEFRSLLPPLRELQGIIMNAPPLVRGQPAPWRYVTKVERENCRVAFKEFLRAERSIENDLREIRNQIGAHRELHSFGEIEALWEKIDADKCVPVMNSFLPVWKAIEHLNIYDWSRSFKDNAFSIFGTPIIHDWADAYTKEEASKLKQKDKGGIGKKTTPAFAKRTQ